MPNNCEDKPPLKSALTNLYHSTIGISIPIGQKMLINLMN